MKRRKARIKGLKGHFSYRLNNAIHLQQSSTIAGLYCTAVWSHQPLVRIFNSIGMNLIVENESIFQTKNDIFKTYISVQFKPGVLFFIESRDND
jgi:hypothetical protein